MGSAYELELVVKCDIPRRNLELLSELMKKLLPIYCDRGIEYLEQVHIVRDHQLEQSVNDLPEQMGLDRGGYSSGPHPAGGVSVPIQNGQDLLCYILLTESHVKKIDDSGIPYDLASTILEEILHTQLYALAWEQHGRLGPKSDNPFRQDLVTVAGCALDEFLVCYIKTQALTSMYSVIHPDGQTEPFCLWYGGNIDDLLKEAKTNLESLSQEPVGITNSREWGQVTATVYRNILEPLARDTAFKLANQVTPPDETTSFEKNQFFQNRIAAHWEQIKVELLEATTDRAGREAHVLQIATIIEEFLESQGISLNWQDQSLEVAG